MKLQKLMENLMGIRRPIGLQDLHNLEFKNTQETKFESRIQIYEKGDYKVVYDTFEKEIINVYRERR